MASRSGVTFVAVYYDRDKQGEGHQTKKHGSVRNPEALERWAERACPRGKRLHSIVANGGIGGSRTIWHEASCFDIGVVEQVFK